MKISDRQAEYAASIAVIGKSGRFPKAGNLNQFWQNLCAGKESISWFTEEELLSAGVDPELLRRPNYVKALGIVEDPDLFDAQFFGYTPREAQMIDPQQRVFLECAWEALEDAGYASDDPGMVGVYASATMSTYMWNLLSNPEILGSSDVMQFMTGNDKDYVATRVSYKLNLRGPSVCVQSACSSSLLAAHLACRSLLTYECDVALAGGVSIGVPLKQGYLYEEGGITSPDGHCRAFDAGANGTISGYGCGVVVLKRLFEAIEDGDDIQAIIRGSAANNDGSNKIGFTAPSVDGQAEVVRAALAVARVPSETISYVEAHGTGTLLGDPIELTALSKAFRSATARKTRCAIGSIKTNIGHLDAAAGVAGLIKTVLTLEHKALPPSLNFETPNPKAGFDASPFYVNTHLSEWPSAGTPRRAGVSSLGLGGTNVHLILEEAPDLDRQTSNRKHHLLVFSAKSQTALESLTARMADHLQTCPAPRLSDVAYTLQVGRKTFPFRRAIVCETVAEAIEGLRQPNGEGVANGWAELRNRPVVFMFPGGGTQYPGMGRELYQQERVFRESFDKCTEVLSPILGRDLRALVHSDTTETESAAAALVRPSLGLPAIFATEYAMAQLFMSWGIKPKSMIGHSLGEYAAACVAGVFSLSDALALVALRGKLFETLPAGAMLSVYLREADVVALGLEDVCIAAINGPDNCVISGKINAIEKATAILESKGIEFRRLHIEAAAHSSMVDSIVDELGSFLKKLKLSAPQIPFISNLTGIWITPEQAVDPDYWVRHLRHTVRFADGISELLKQPDIALLELGPGHTLGTLARGLVRGKPVPVVSSMKHPHETAPETRVLYMSLARLWLSGIDADWKALHAGEQCRRASLPTYPFERQRYFVERVSSTGSQPGLLRKKPDMTDWFYAPSWKQIVPWRRLTAQQEASASWMVFSGGGKLESDFVKELRKANDEVNVVMAGPESSTFERLGANEYRIDPANANHYKKLVPVFPDSGSANFVHFWSLTGDLDENPGEPAQTTFHLAFDSLFFLAQTVGEANTVEQKNIWIMSNGLAEVSQDDLSSPDKAILLGPCRTIPLEYPNLRCALIDVGTLERNTANALLQCCTRPPQTSFMAYRMGRFWSQCVEPLPLPASRESARVRHSGVYVITGGMGGIGLTLALHLARKTEAKLILVDIAAPPARPEWDRLLEMESTPAAARFQISALRSLEELHTPLLISQADVCEERQMRAVVAEAIEKFGAIHGVIHAAGMPGGGIMQFKIPAEIETVLAPKVKGTRVLESIFKDLNLDFFVACSSVTSVQGEFTQVDNCSANAFLDAFCLNNSFQLSTRAVAIGWDVWKDVGMAQNAARSADLEHEHSQRFAAALSTAEAIEVFDRVLNFDASRSHVLVSTLDLDLSPRRANLSAQASEGNASGATPELYSRPELSSVFVAPRNEIEHQIAEVWQSVLGLKAIGVYDNFWELGGHSVLATQVVSRLKEKFHIPLPLRALFETPTIEKLGETVRLQTESAGSRTLSGPLAGTEAQTTPIRRVDRNGKLALSYGQERLWFIHQLDPENVAYNIPSAVRIQGPLDVEALEKSLQEVVRRHESLRTRFVTVNGEPQQVIDPTFSVKILVTDLSNFSESREVEAERLAQEEARQPFDLEHGPLLRAKLLRLGSQDHVMILNMNHTISDGWSTSVLVTEVSAIYNNFSVGQPSPLPELEIQYADFSAWQRELLSGPILEKQLEYWKGKLAGVEPLMLPIDKPRLGIQRQDGAITRFIVPVELTESLNSLARKQGVTLYMILLAAFQALLCRYTRQYDIAVGSPVGGRLRSEIEPLIGNFINMLVLRTDLSGEMDSIQLLHRVKETTLEAQAHQDVPFEKLVEVLLPQRDLTRSPLFQVVFGLLNMPWTGLQLGTAQMLPFPVHTGAAQFEMSLIMVEFNSAIQSYIEYHAGLFEAATIERMVGHFSRLLSGITSNPHAPIHSLEILSSEERRILLEDFNATASSIPKTTIVRLFEEQVDRSPNTTAVRYGKDSLSYNELNQRANQLAHYLKQMGVGPEMLVGICLNRSLDMVVTLLGVLKSGGAYVPLDPSYPVERLAFMLEDAQIPVIVTESSLLAGLPMTKIQVVNMDEDWKDISKNSVATVESCVQSSNLAYVIYTSGSTGQPKGVGVTHKGMINYVNWARQTYKAHQGSGSPVHSSLAFDLTVTSIYPALVAGGCVEVLSQSAGMEELVEHLETSDYSLLKLTPSHLRMLSVLLEKSEKSAKGENGARVLVIGGEALRYADLESWRKPGSTTRLINEYGPTETVVGSTIYEVQDERQPGDVVIGKPIANTEIYVLDANLELVPAGVAGELFIGGAGLARGYVNRPSLTAERFIANPFGESGARMYRTGDLARWRADGNLEYLGRNDQQVKIRGFRIELGEIEAALEGHPSVAQSVVLAREDQSGEKRLVAYMVKRADAEKPNASELEEYLKARLPEYMAPAIFVELEKWPLNHNGKIDRKNLPQPGMEIPQQEYVGPRNSTEETLCRLWQEVMRVERVGIHDNFFRIGGHSLMAVQLAARLRGSLKVDIPLRRMFEAPTIAQLAIVIDQELQTAGVNGAPSHSRPAIKRVARKAALVDVD